MKRFYLLVFAFSIAAAKEYSREYIDVETGDKVYNDELWPTNNYQQIPYLTARVRMISRGSLQVCALDEEGVKCWGDDENVLTKVPSTLKSPRAISAGGVHTCALDEEGIKCWGHNGSGQLNVPLTLKSPRAISAGGDSTCALDNEGVKCWGYKDSHLAIRSTLKSPHVISSGRFHSCGLDEEGVKCWGSNRWGEINIPRNLRNPRAISASSAFTCVIDDDGVKCWGYKGSDQINVPSTLKSPHAISSGKFHTCALDVEGLKCWGSSSLYLRFDISEYVNLEKADPIFYAHEFISRLSDLKVRRQLIFLLAKLSDTLLYGQEFEVKSRLSKNLSFVRGFYFLNFKDDILELQSPQDMHFRYLATVLAQSLRSQKPLISEASKGVAEKLLVSIGDVLTNREITRAQVISVLNQILSETAYIAELENSPRLFGFAAFYEWFLKYAQTGDVEQWQN